MVTSLHWHTRLPGVELELERPGRSLASIVARYSLPGRGPRPVGGPGPEKCRSLTDILAPTPVRTFLATVHDTPAPSYDTARDKHPGPLAARVGWD